MSVVVEAGGEAGRAGPPAGAGGERLFVRLLLLGDVAVCCLSVVAAYYLRELATVIGLLSPFQHDLTTYLVVLPAVIPIWLISLESLGLYRPRRSLSRFSEFVAIFKAVSFTALALMALSYLRKYDYSRAVMLAFWLCGLNFAWGFRATMSDLRRRQLRSGEWGTNAVIVGCGELGRMVLQRMRHHPEFGYRPLGFVCWNDQEAEVIEGLPVLGSAHDLPDVLAAHDIQEAFVAEPGLRPGEMLEVIGQCEHLPTVFRVVSGPMEALTAAMDIDGIADLPIVSLRSRPFRPWQRAVKRLTDLLLGTVLLALAAVPMLIIALAIRLTSRGPAIFRQERIGHFGRPFTMYKFRSMEDTGDGPDTTRIGRFLRRSSLDELPQLFNVIVGNMSLVGPRPEIPELVARYEPWQRKRLEVKPGITGLWQILGRKDLPLTENLQYDFYYIRNQSLLFDLAILLKTIPVVLRGQGAY